MAKKKASTSPTKRTLALCRKAGWTSQVVERWNQFAKVRQDLFGCIDVVSCNGTSIIGIQSTTGGHVADHIQKIKDEPRALIWLQSGGRLFVHGWVQRMPSKRWECREIEITVADLSAATATDQE